MTRRRIMVLSIALAVILVPALVLATWDRWLVLFDNEDTISWSYAMLTTAFPILAILLREVAVFAAGFLACHFADFRVPDPAVFAENERLMTEVAALRIRLANAQMIAENLRKQLAEANEKTKGTT